MISSPRRQQPQHSPSSSPLETHRRGGSGSSADYARMVFQMVLLACFVHLALHWRFVSQMSTQTAVGFDQPSNPGGQLQQLQKNRKLQPQVSRPATIQGQRTVLVMGALSFVGRALVDALLARGDKVVVTTTKYQTEAQTIHAVYLEQLASKNPSLSYRQSGGYASFDSLMSTFERHHPHLVCHLEVFDNGDDDVDISYEEISITKSLTNALELSQAFGVHNVVFISSRSTGAIDDAVAFDTRQKHLELLGYGYHHQHGLNVAALRFSNVYGPHGAKNELPIVLLDHLTQQTPMGKTQEHAGVFFDFLYINDAVQGIIQALDTHKGWEVINVASGNVVSFPELVRASESVTGQAADPQPIEVNDPPPAAPDTSKARAKLGFSAKTPLKNGLEETFRWYKEDSGKQAPPRPLGPRESPEEVASNSKKKICFVCSVFGNSVEEMDTIPSAFKAPESVSKNPDKFSFLLFTNLQDMRVPGWKTIVLSLDLPHNIIKSRFPKFMAWKLDFVMDECRVIFYADGGWLPVRAAPTWRRLAELTIAHEAGLMQMKHTRTNGPLDELSRISRFNKDTPEKVKAEMEWLQAQPDFIGNGTMYCNMCFGYDPHNKKYQELSTFFWNRYSTNQGTWRDQPLWCYSLQHFRVEPALLGYWPSDVRIPHRQKWKMLGEVGFNGHKYTTTNKQFL